MTSPRAEQGTEHSAATIAGHPVPPRLAEGTDSGLAAWRGRLPELVGELLSRWQLRAGAPFLPGGSSAWVAPVRDRDDAERVLKVAWAHDESRDEAAGMAAWRGHGAARVHRHERRGETVALLLDRVRPGTPLAEMLTWPERDEVVAEVARRLWLPPHELVRAEDAADFRPLGQMCAWWADEARKRAEAGGSPLPRDLVEHGLQLFRDLPSQWDGQAVLLATDLHPSNVLASGRGRGRGENDGENAGKGEDEADAPDGRSAGNAPVTAGTEVLGRRWVLIDPKPYVGDPHYDVLQHILNDPDRLRDHPGLFAERMAELAGLDPHRVRRWLLARCVQEAGVMEAAAEAALTLVEAGVE